MLSGVATAAHVIEVSRSAAAYHRFGVIVITVGFGVLTVAAVLRIILLGEENPRIASSRLLAAMSLFLFAVSFVHFSRGEGDSAWAPELAFHHAGIPLALFILIQDYRFVLLDALIRFLANGLLAGMFAAVLVANMAGLSGPGADGCGRAGAGGLRGGPRFGAAVSELDCVSGGGCGSGDRVAAWAGVTGMR